MYTTSSAYDFGTLYQIRNLVNRRNVKANPSKNVNASEDFFLMVVHSHIIAAAMHELSMDSVDENPTAMGLTNELWVSEDSDKRKQILEFLCESIVNKYVDLIISAFQTTSPFLYNPQAGLSYTKPHSYTDDQKNNYAREVLSLGLLYMEFIDSIREGDGDRLLCCCRFLLLIYKASKRNNYALEALNLLTQCKFVLPPRLVQQLLWSRFVNLHGHVGKNVPLDLHMKHLNATLKNSITALGANKIEKSILHLGRCIGQLQA